jgi:copper(I)-binding protein
MTVERLHCAAAAALLLLASTMDADAADITVRDAWFRALPAAVPSGGYFTLSNGGDKPVTLTDVESPGCGVLMMHKSSSSGMEHVMALPLASGSTVRFEPNGYHLMCMEAKLAVGKTVPVTLTFEDGRKLTTDFRVRNALGK